MKVDGGKRAKWAAAMAVIALAASSVLVPLTAKAALPEQPWDASCSAGQRCIFFNADFSGPDAGQTGDDWAYTSDECLLIEGDCVPINDNTSSMRNRKPSYSVRWYNDGGWSGYVQCLAGGTSDNFANSNDEYSSHRNTTNQAFC